MRRGVTLIETLAAVALLGLVASVAALGLAGAGDAARLGDAITIVRDLDQRARTLAQSGAPVTLCQEEDRLYIEGAAADGRSEILAERWLPEAIDLALVTANGNAIDRIRFDRLGRSSDYRIHLAGGGREVTLSISGLTGWGEMEESR